jgi:hypothetical protein
MLASLASVIVSGHDCFTANDTRWEIASTEFATSVIFTNIFFAVSSGAFYLLSGGFFWWMSSKDTDSNVDISLSLFISAHPFQLHKSPRTLFVTLEYIRTITLL